MNFENLTFDGVPSASRLSTQAGWNQTPEDWRRLIRLAPDGVKVWVADDEIRASYSIFAMGLRVAWIGMVLVDQDFRGRGLGKTLFTRAMEDARNSCYKVLGLDATELGEPIYAKFGFQPLVSLARWQGILSFGITATSSTRLVSGFTPAIADLDARLLGEDRSALLADLAKYGGTFFCIEQAGEVVGYGVLRPGRSALHIGPVVATTLDGFREILAGIACAFPGREVVCDSLDDRAAPVLSAAGLTPQRSLKRMTHPRQDRCLCGEGIWCAAGFEWG